MKKIRKLVFMFMYTLIIMCATQTTDVKAAGSDKESAEVITHGKLYESTLGETAQWYTFTTVDYVNYYELTATYGKSTYWVTLTVYDEDNTQVDSVTAYDEGNILKIKLAPNTKYYIKVGGYSGDYSFKLVPKVDAADVKERATAVESNKLYEESLVSSDVDWYTFDTVDYVNYYTFTATYGKSSYYVTLTVYDEDNTQVGSITAYDEGAKRNIKLAPNTKYYIKASGYVGNYSFKLEPKADIADIKEDAQTIEFNKLYEESYCISDGDADWYKITTGIYYQSYELLLNEMASESHLYVYDEANTCVYSDTYVNSTCKANIALLPNQTYYIKTVGSSGTYSLKVTPGEYYNGWYSAKNDLNETKSYWYEGGLRQGTYEDPKGVLGDGTVRGREIYDPESDGWYWLDSCYDGAKATSKEVWMPYIYQNEADWGEEELNANAAASGDMANQVAEAIRNRSGKWVRYDANGKMYKGWYTHWNNDYSEYSKYYYDPKTGLMAKGNVTISGKEYYFDPITGILQ